MVLPYKVGEYVAASFTETPTEMSGFRFLCPLVSHVSGRLAILNDIVRDCSALRCKFGSDIMPVMHPRVILLIIFFTCSGMSFAQVRPDSLPPKADTAKPKAPLKTVSFSADNFNYGNRAHVDSLRYSLDSFQLVHPFLINTGNLGSPGHHLIPMFSPAEPFSVRPDAFSYFGFNRYNRRFYSSNQPYTLLQYFVGQPKEQFVDVLHTRNFGENLNFSFHFIRARSEGFYNRQNTSNTSLRTNLWYKSPEKRYAFMADVFWTGANVAENGGLAEDSTFEFGEQVDRQVNEVNLNAAGTVVRKRDIWMKHTFAIGKVTDTLTLDTARSYNVITPAWGISIISEVFDEKYNYTDGFPTAGFYDVIYRDSLQTQDSTYSWRVNNSLRLERFNQYGEKSMRGYAGVRHEAGEYFNDTIYAHVSNIFIDAMVEWNFRDGLFTLNSNANYVAAGENEQDYYYDLFAKYRLSESRTDIQAFISMKVYAQTRTPDMIFRHYSGNHFRWMNSFSSTGESGIITEFNYRGPGIIQTVAASYTMRILDGYLFFDSTFLPLQFDSTLYMNGAALILRFNFSPVFLAVNYNYTKVSDKSILRLPEHYIAATVHGNFNIFKNAMQLQFGVDVTWFSEFTAEAYMPNVAQFYLQNNRKAGNYTYIAPWVSFRIKPVRVFVKVEHANAGLMGRKYFLLDHYPANDLAVKIGISWLFSD